MADRIQWYVRDVVSRIRERAREASAENDPFNRGRAFAFAEVLSMMQNDAVGFQIELSEVSLDLGDPFCQFGIKRAKDE